MDVIIRDADDRQINGAITGEVDAGNCSAVSEVLLAEDPAGRSLEVDLSGLTFIDSSGISQLLEVRTAVTDAGGEMVLTDLQPAVRRVLEITGLLESFGVH